MSSFEWKLDSVIEAIEPLLYDDQYGNEIIRISGYLFCTSDYKVSDTQLEQAISGSTADYDITDWTIRVSELARPINNRDDVFWRHITYFASTANKNITHYYAISAQCYYLGADHRPYVVVDGLNTKLKHVPIKTPDAVIILDHFNYRIE